ncbi:FtsX-like permease family protein [Isoptericola sp. 4D.3]|uniref:FtsX-like permease family protein n=1 Tax=Isoptericola peretonis TaxID=2918523 RepID=A0ABT0IYD3_9MICO|nr:FtsX-like permease family protein [Isoptericola sp. 4D.3]
MSRARLLVRRAGANRGLLVLVALLVATVTAALGTGAGMVRSAEARIVHDGLTRGGEPGVVAVTTRLAPEEEVAAQDAALHGVVDALFAPAPYDLGREEIPDDDSDDPFVRWTLTPDVAATDAADLRLLASGTDALLEAVLADDDVAVRGAEVTGDLGQRAHDTVVATGAASAVALVPMLVLALAGVVAVAQVARLLAATRAGEVRLLVSRGASPVQLTAAAALEAGVVVLAGVAVGVGAAVAVLAGQGAWQGAAGGSPVAALAPSAAATAVLAVLVLVAVEGLQARAAAALRPADSSGRARQAAAWGTVALVVVAAGVTLWLLRRYGSPLVPTPDGGQTDPAAAAAPALVLAAAAAGAVALLGPLARTWAAIAARRPDLRVLTARQVARRLAVTAVPVVLVVVAAGSVVLASAYDGTGHALRVAAATVAAGSDVRLVAAPGTSPGSVAEYESLPGASAAAPARVEEGRVDTVPVSTTGLPAERIASVASGAGGQQEVDEIAGGLRGPGPYADNPRLPVGTTGLELRATGQYYVVDQSLPGGVAGEPATWASLVEAVGPMPTEQGRLPALEGSTIGLTLWLADADGRLVGVDVEDLDVDLDGAGEEARPMGPDEGTVELRAEVPPAPRTADGAPGSWTVVALDTLLPGSPSALTTLRLRVDAMAAVTDDGKADVDVDGTDWAPVGDDPTRLAVFRSREGTGLSLAAQADFDAAPGPVRVMATDGEREGVPAVLSRDLATMLDVGPGGSTQLPLEVGGRLPVRVVDVVDVLPGSLHPAAAMVGLAEMQVASLRLSTTVPGADEMWVRAVPGAGDDDVRRLATAAGQVVAAAGTGPVQVTTSTGTGGADAAEPVRLAFAVAALASVLLALVGVAAVSVATVRERRGEVAVLRAVGVPPRAQGSGRALELVAVTAAALVTGLLAGWALAAAVVPGLAASTLTGFAVVPAPSTTLALGTALAPGLLLVAGLAAVALAVRATVTGQAREGAYREEVR